MRIFQIKEIWENGENFNSKSLIFKEKVDVFAEEAIFEIIEKQDSLDENEKLELVKTYVKISKEHLLLLIDVLEKNRKKTYDEKFNKIKTIIEALYFAYS